MFKTFVASLAVGLLLAASASAQTKPAAKPAAATATAGTPPGEDRYVGYYYPKPTSTEVFDSQMQTIASMDRALATRAVTLSESGSSLPHSASFQQSFPATGGLHHSGYLWLNTNGVLRDLAGLVQSPAIKSLMDSREPLLVVLDGETERIHAASRSRLTSLILDSMLLFGESGKL